MSVSAQEYIEGFIARARVAQGRIEFSGQAEIDDICARITRAGTTDAFARKIAEFAVEESRKGEVNSKIAKM